MFRKAARGFTLIELMIVVAIIGILAAIAIPNFMKYQLRTKRSEGSVNVAGIRTAEIAWAGTHDSFIDAPATPATPKAIKQAWPAKADAGKWTVLGWRPEGDVYFSYVVEVEEAANIEDNGTVTVPATQMTITATADLDGDEALSCWTYQKPAGDGTTYVAASGNCETDKLDTIVMNGGDATLEDVF